MYPYFKLLIFGYRSRFLTKFSTLLTFLYALNTNQLLVLVLDLGNMVKKWPTMSIHGQGVRTITILRGCTTYFFDLATFFFGQHNFFWFTQRGGKICEVPLNFCLFARSPLLISPICDVGWFGLSDPLPMYALLASLLAPSRKNLNWSDFPGKALEEANPLDDLRDMDLKGLIKKLKS